MPLSVITVLSTLSTFLALTTVHAAGHIDVTVDSTGPEVVSRGAQRVVVLRLTLQNYCERMSASSALQEIRLQHQGMGRTDDIAAVYALSNDVRASPPAQVQSDGTVVLRLSRVDIAPCSTQEVEIAADYAASAEVASEHRWVLSARDPLLFSGSPSIHISDYRSSSLARTTPDLQEAISLEYLALDQRVRYGSHRTIARFRLTNSGRFNQRVLRMALTNIGSARDNDLQNIVLTDARGNRLSSIVPQMSGDQVLLTIGDVVLDRSSSRTLELRADVHVGRRRTIQFIVEEPSDLTVSRIRRRRN